MADFFAQYSGLALAGLAILWLIVREIAPKTKTELDDKLVAALDGVIGDKAEEKVKALLGMSEQAETKAPANGVG